VRSRLGDCCWQFCNDLLLNTAMNWSADNLVWLLAGLLLATREPMDDAGRVAGPLGSLEAEYACVLLLQPSRRSMAGPCQDYAWSCGR
jgi:hypothetical protein